MAYTSMRSLLASALLLVLLVAPAHGIRPGNNGGTATGVVNPGLSLGVGLDFHCCVEQQVGPGEPFWSTQCCCSPPLEPRCDRGSRSCRCGEAGVSGAA